MTRSFRSLIRAIAIIVLAAITSLQAQTAPPDGPWIGTWKRNNDKSSTRQNSTSIFTMWVEGDGFRYTLEVTPEAGPPTRMEAFARFDGKPYSEKGNPVADHNVFRRVADWTYSLIDLKDGKEVIHFTISISPDGKTRTSVARSKNAKGEDATTMGVWDRVK